MPPLNLPLSKSLGLLNWLADLKSLMGPVELCSKIGSLGCETPDS